MMCVQGCAVKPSLPVLTLTPMVRKQSVEVKCGKNVCGEGEECCNSSCGICVKKGGFCTEQWCGPEDEVVEPPKATILPVERKGDKVKCGKNTCGEGEVCCNDSCGICTKKGGACTLQWCGPMPGEVEKPPKATLPVLPPKATFAPVGQKCGRNVCGAGQFCCNSSCSQCAPLGGGCTMQFCGHGTE
ncbi:hypothetical protein QBC39DRAFT_361877 [Podospora conica]|nr:hypothetical protein QBC39DRAFT_361877 [Schizothecium conicum]